MLITYFILLLISVIFKIMHWPGSSMILLISPLFPLIDIIVQSIRKKADKEARVLSSIGVFFLSLFFLYKYLNWPFASLWFIISFIILTVFLVLFFQKKVKYTTRYVLVGILILFAIFNFSLKGSSFRLAYELGDPFNQAVYVPHYQTQALAHDYYLECDYQKASQLIERNIDHINDLIEDKHQPDYMEKINLQNLEISQDDLNNIKNRTWDNYEPLLPEDMEIQK